MKDKNKLYTFLTLSFLACTITCIFLTLHKPDEKFIKEYWLTEHQLQWLKEHPTITFVSTPDHAPFEFIGENGEFSGLVAEYTNHIAKILDIELVHIPTKSWKETIEYARTKKADFITTASVTPERSQYLNFSQKYINLPRVIFSKKDVNAYRNTLSSFKNKTIAIPAGYSLNKFIKKNYPEIIIKNYNTPRNCIIAASLGEVDAYIGETVNTYRTIAQEGITNLTHYSPSGYNASQGFGIRDDWPELVEIFNIALAQITRQQKQEFLKKWYRLPKKTTSSDIIALTLTALLVTCTGLISYFTFMSYTQKKKRQKEREISQAKTQLFQSISNEIRAPLGKMIEMLKQSIEEQDNKTQQRQIQTAFKNSRYLLNIVNEILDLSKINSGKMSITPMAHRLEKVILSVEPVFLNTSDENDTELKITLNEEDYSLPYRVLIDELRVQQILATIIRQFSNTKDPITGLITVNASWTPPEERHGLSTLFNIDDIPAKDGYLKVKVSGPILKFSDASQKRNHPSIIEAPEESQLSLRVCNNLCSLMDGMLTIQTTKSNTCFNIVLPLDIVQSEKYKIEDASSPISHKQSAERTQHILIVDDSIIYQRLTMSLLSHAPYKTYPVSSGAEALTSMAENTFDCVLMDIEMPEMNGIETIRKRRAMETQHKLPHQIVFALTGHKDREKEFLEAGFTGVITKPMDLQSFLDATSAHIS